MMDKLLICDSRGDELHVMKVFNKAPPNTGSGGVEAELHAFLISAIDRT